MWLLATCSAQLLGVLTLRHCFLAFLDPHSSTNFHQRGEGKCKQGFDVLQTLQILPLQQSIARDALQGTPKHPNMSTPLETWLVDHSLGYTYINAIGQDHKAGRNMCIESTSR